MDEILYKIGDVAKSSGFSIQTLRYYETEKIIKPNTRSPSGYRLYNKSIFSQLDNIKHLKSMGFSLPEIRDLTRMCSSSGIQTRDVKIKAEQKLEQINEKYEMLKSIKNKLESALNTCPGDDSNIAYCPIIQPSPERLDNNNN